VIWLLLDRTVPPVLCDALERRGIRALHVGAERELACADARLLLESAIEDECLLVTRNYADFTRLATAFRHAGRSFPGILFLPPGETAIEPSADRIRDWLEAGGAREAEGRCAWLEAGAARADRRDPP